MSAETWRTFHKWATWVWVGLISPTLIWWRESIPWLSFMSIYAIVIGHVSAWQASRAEQEAEN